VCTNTHDTKRSADVRARLDVLSEMPDQWMRSIRRWRMLNRGHRISVGRRYAPDPNTEYLFYQALLGVWPLGLGSGELPVPEIMDGLHERLQAYMLKAVKEGKSRTSWTDPDEEFEAALKKFIHTVLFRSPTFISDFAALATRVSRPGLWNSLSRTLLHLTVPGVPDIYQGDEQWTFSLVDPDNRRPVDYEARRQMLEDLGPRGEEVPHDFVRMVSSPENGRVKTHVVRSVLRARHDHRELFSVGDYAPLEVEGVGAEHVVAFARTHGGEAAVVVVPRLSASLVGGRNAPIGEEVWGDSVLVLPAELSGRRWRCALTGQEIDGARSGQGLSIAGIFESLPAALLLSEGR
jgi:(1->4)-alpha-D-glucan 1-alpha-D-glucosylmutase